MAKKRITVDSVVNPLEGSAFFVVPPPPPPHNQESDESVETPITQEPKEEPDLSDSVVTNADDENIDDSEALGTQGLDSETETEETSADVQVTEETETEETSADVQVAEETGTETETPDVLSQEPEDEELPPRRKVGRPKKHRYTKRHSFELFTDQVSDLRALQAWYKLEKDRKISLSDLVREALDNYLQEKGHSNPVFRPKEY